MKETIATIVSRTDALRLLYWVALEAGYTLLRTDPQENTPVFTKDGLNISIRRQPNTYSWEFETEDQEAPAKS